MGKAKFFLTEYIERKRLSDDVYCFYFARNGLSFLAGQYVQISLSHKNPDKDGSSRYFTIASSPTEKNFLILV